MDAPGERRRVPRAGDLLDDGATRRAGARSGSYEPGEAREGAGHRRRSPGALRSSRRAGGRLGQHDRLGRRGGAALTSLRRESGAVARASSRRPTQRGAGVPCPAATPSQGPSSTETGGGSGSATARPSEEFPRSASSSTPSRCGTPSTSTGPSPSFEGEEQRSGRATWPEFRRSCTRTGACWAATTSSSPRRWQGAGRGPGRRFLALKRAAADDRCYSNPRCIKDYTACSLAYVSAPVLLIVHGRRKSHPFHGRILGSDMLSQRASRHRGRHTIHAKLRIFIQHH